MINKATNAARSAATKSTFTPNLSSRYKVRTLRRIKMALGFSIARLNEVGREVYSRDITEAFGNCTKPLSMWLRQHLLFCVDDSFAFNTANSHCKMYALNHRAAKVVRQVLEEAEGRKYSDMELVAEWAKIGHETELANLQFGYYEREHCARLWHPLQNMRKGMKHVFWSSVGLPHNYDIQAAAPTLIYQKAKMLGAKRAEVLECFLNEPKEFRQYLADVAGIKTKAAKEVLNALFCGANLGANHKFDLFHVLGKDEIKVELLKADPLLTALREDIARCWNTLKSAMPEVFELDATEARESQLRWRLYFSLERQVLDAICSELDRLDVRHFKEHDGFRTDKEIDMSSVEAHVLSSTDFSVSLVKEPS
jgi:hypothetical protein